MTGQTQRAGPWESNLGLEPEWDGASGLWWMVGNEKQKFAGSIDHVERNCMIRLTPSLGEATRPPYPREYVDPKLWHGQIMFPGEDFGFPVTVLASIVPPGNNIPYWERIYADFFFQSYHYSLDRFTLYPRWLYRGRHFESPIETIDQAKWERIYVQIDVSNKVIPRRNMVVCGKVESDNHNEAHRSTHFILDSGMNDTSKTTVELRFTEPKPIADLDEYDISNIPNSIFSWVDWVTGLCEILAQESATKAKLFVPADNGGLRSLYLPSILARNPTPKSDLAFREGFIFLEDTWQDILDTWRETWKSDHDWSYATELMRRILHSSESRVFIEEYFLMVFRVIISRYHAEEGRDGVSEEILKSKLQDANIMHELETVREFPRYLPNFGLNKLVTVFKEIRDEFIHPSPHDDRINLRRYLRITNNRVVYPLAHILYSAIVSLFSDEVLQPYAILNTSANSRIDKFDDPYDMLLRDWNNLYKAIDEDIQLRKQRRKQKKQNT